MLGICFETYTCLETLCTSAFQQGQGIRVYVFAKNFFAGDTMTFFSDNPALENLFYIYEHELFYQLKKAGIK